MAEHLVAHPAYRVPVPVGAALVEWDDRVLPDLDVLGTDLGAALGDVAVAKAALTAGLLGAVEDVFGVHLQSGDTHEIPRAVVTIEEAVGANDVADVLAEITLDAAPELVQPADICLLNSPWRAIVGGCREG
jgi:hypothetical protein